MKPLISIIVPIYNTESYLEKCLDSLVNQTLKNIEIILINDGSLDNSEKIIKKYLKKYSDKIVYYKKENEGQGVARNYAIKLARGEYLTFVDSDDFVEETMLEELYKKAKDESSDIVACTKVYVVKSETLTISSSLFDVSDPYRKYILNNSGPVGKIIKREIIQNNNLYFPNLRAYEDIAIVPLWGLYAKKISYIDKPFYYYIIHEGSTMKQLIYNEKLTHIYSSLDNLYIKFKLLSGDKYYSELEWIYIEHLLHAASLRFYKFKKTDEIHKINCIMKEKFPNWFKNKYYKTMNIKYKIICTLLYKEKLNLLKIILK